jgi:hypothetical protein
VVAVGCVAVAVGCVAVATPFGLVAPLRGWQAVPISTGRAREAATKAKVRTRATDAAYGMSEGRRAKKGWDSNPALGHIAVRQSRHPEGAWRRRPVDPSTERAETVAMRRVAAVAVVAFATAFARGARADAGAISITVDEPARDALVPSDLSVTVHASSPDGIAGVTASVGSVSSPLYDEGDGSWTGYLVLTAIPAGSATLTIVATDTLGGTSTATVPILVDHPPTVTFGSPHVVARPSLRLTATCVGADGTPCKSITAIIDDGSGTVLASGVSSIDETVSFAPWAPYIYGIPIAIEGEDSFGVTSGIERDVFIEPSTELTVVGQVPGKILDARGGRMLYVADDGSTHLGGACGDVLIASESGYLGWVTPRGALVQLYADSELVELIDFAVVDHGGVSSYDVGVSRSATFAAWQLLTDKTKILTRDLRTTDGPTTLPFALGPSGGRNPTIDDVGNLFASHAFASTVDRLVQWDPSTATWTTLTYYLEGGATRATINSIIADADLVAYSVDPAAYLGLWVGGKDVEISRRDLVPAYAHHTYELAGGWMAYSQHDATGVLRVYRRSPAGATDVGSDTTISTDTKLEVLAPSGDLTLFNEGSRFLTLGALPPKKISIAQGKGMWRDGTWLVALDGTLFGLTGGPGDTGVCDSGSDGGGDTSTDSASEAASDAPVDAGGADSADAAGSADATVDAHVDLDAAEPAAEPVDAEPSSSGCGCRTSGDRAPLGAAAITIAFSGALLARRRRR